MQRRADWCRVLGMDIDNMLTRQETADAIGISTATLDRWRNKNTGPAFHHVGHRYLYKRDDLTKWLDSTRADTAATPKKTYVCPEFFTDARMNSRSPEARLLYQGLWCWEHNGTIDYNPELFRQKIIPGIDADIDALLSELAAIGVIARQPGLVLIFPLPKPQDAETPAHTTAR